MNRFTSVLAMMIMLGLIGTGAAVASPFDAVTSAQSHVMISAGVNVSNGADYINATVFYLPQDLARQRVFKEEVLSSPKSKELRLSDRMIISWPAVEGVARFAISQDIKTEPILTTFSKLTPLRRDTNPDRALEMYLHATKLIDLNNPSVQESALRLAGSAKTQEELAWKTAEFVRGAIKYNISTLTQDVNQPASWTLRNRQGVCDEITVLFIALLRANGIPARFVNGMVFTQLPGRQPDFGSHAWAEAYFPSAGWVPFDVTFGEIGWLDSAHLRIRDSYDADETSVDFRWKGPEQARFLPVTTTGTVTPMQVLDGPNLGLSITNLREAVGPSSAVAVLANISNPTDLYVSGTVTIEKSPGEVMENSKSALLEPHSSKVLHFSVRIPSDLDEGEFTSVIEAKMNTGARDKAMVRFGTAYPALTFIETLESLEIEQAEAPSSIMEMKCAASSGRYDLLEPVKISCAVRNTGPEFSGKICDPTSCAKLGLAKGEEKTLMFYDIARAAHKAKISIIGTDGNEVIHRTVPIRVSFSPVFMVKRVECPSSVKYGEQSGARLVLNASAPIRDVVAIVEGLEPVSVGEFIGEQTITVPFSGAEVDRLTSDLVVYATGYLEDGRRVEDFETCKIKVTDKPWYKDMADGMRMAFEWK